MRALLALLCVVSLGALQLADAGDFQSGLQPGDTAVAFHVDDVTGPRQGKTLCYACAFGKHRVVNIQTTKLSDELLGLIKKLDGMVDSPSAIKGESVHAFVVMLTEDPDIAAEQLEAAAAKHEFKNIPLTIYDELPGPPPYKLSDDAEVTVMMWSDNKVTKNHAFASGELDQEAVEAIVADAQEHLTK